MLHTYEVCYYSLFYRDSRTNDFLTISLLVLELLGSESDFIILPLLPLFISSLSSHLTLYFYSVCMTSSELLFFFVPRCQCCRHLWAHQIRNAIYVCSLVNLLTFKHSCVSLRGHVLWSKHFHWFNFSCEREKGGVSPKQVTYTEGERKTLHSTFLWYHWVFNFLQQGAMLYWFYGKYRKR